jgi:hypothetical protein
MSQSMTLEQTDDERGFSRRSVRLLEDGGLRIEGHDMGPGVEAFWGVGLDEYEYARTVLADRVVRLRRVPGLAARDDLLGALHDRYGHPGGTRELEELFVAHGIETEFWNRVGS